MLLSARERDCSYDALRRPLPNQRRALTITAHGLAYLAAVYAALKDKGCLARWGLAK